MDGLQDYLGRPAAFLPVRHMSVINMHNTVFQFRLCQIMDHNLTIDSELPCKAVGNLFQKIQGI